MTAPTRAARKPRGEGQWALGHREPLNPNERSKKDDNPLNVRARIENIYAHRGFASIDPADLRGRFRWYGLYTQRRPGIDGGRTAVLEPEELEDEYFMLRIRVDSGQLDLAQLRAIGSISQRFAPDTADVPYEANDVAFIGVEHPEHGPGFDLWVGGGLSTNPMLAKRLGVWVPLDEVPDAWLGVISIFRDYGYRRLRNRARLKFLLADWGVERFREVLETEYLHRKLVDGPPPVLPGRPYDHIGVHEQPDRNRSGGGAPRARRVSGSQLARLADVVEAHGSGRVRTTPYQKLVVLDVPPHRVDSLVEALRDIGLEARPSTWRQHTMACTGIEFCKLAIVETKALAATVVADLEKRLADLDVTISINVNGCPNACARTQVADIGLKGQLVPGPDGELVEGFQVHLGGGLTMAAGENASLGRKLRGLKTTSADLVEYVERLARRYAAGRTEGESFARWVTRADEEALR